MTVYRAEYHAGKWQVVGTSDGINGRVNCGPKWQTPKEAAAYVTRMEELRAVSPLRDPVPSSAGDSTSALGGSGDAHQQNGASDGPIVVASAGPLGDGTLVRPEATPPGFWPD